jgi:serine/threonine-protein kinase
MFYFLYGIIFLIAAFQLQHYLPLLPDPMATRFEMNGTPNGWMSREGFALYYAIFLIFMTGAFALAGALLKKTPDRYINIPHKGYWLAPERREKSLRSLQRMTDMIGVVIGFFIVLMMQAVIVANLDKYPQLGFDRMMPVLGILIAFILCTLLYVRRRFRAPGER